MMRKTHLMNETVPSRWNNLHWLNHSIKLMFDVKCFSPTWSTWRTWTHRIQTSRLCDLLSHCIWVSADTVGTCRSGNLSKKQNEFNDHHEKEKDKNLHSNFYCQHYNCWPTLEASTCPSSTLDDWFELYISHNATVAVFEIRHFEWFSQNIADKRPDDHLEGKYQTYQCYRMKRHQIDLHGIVFIVARLVMQMTHSSSCVDDGSKSLSSNLLSSFSCN